MRRPSRRDILKYGAALPFAGSASANWWPRATPAVADLGPGYDIVLVIGDSNNHYGPSYDAAIDVTHPQMYQLRQNNSTFQLATEPDIDHADNASSSNKIGYCTTFVRNYYIPNRLAADRLALIIPRGIGGTGVSIAGARVWASMELSCTLTNGDTAVSFSSPHALTTHPTQAIRMYAIGAGIPTGTQVNAIPTTTTATLSQAFTGTTGTYDVRFRGSGIQMCINSLAVAMAQSGTNRVVAILMSLGTNDIFGEAYQPRLANGIADLRANGAGLSEDVPFVINGIVPATVSALNGNSVYIQGLNEDVASWIPNSAYASPYGGVFPAPHDTELFSDGESGGKHFNAASMRDYGGRYYAKWAELAA